ncbi:MAG: hypothetical protein KJ728_05585 [Alphaproteobacteria bacterium]|jgi:hypothetical protein|uniref:Uncharacterized protein n=1 Tax=Brevundimonas mediterranea TaxID=74329 RepID=A0A6G7EE64_9CAUL|nr:MULTISPECIES: hypothetical protein [Brevundimonas]MBU1272477.1 hypothetical protein [Alphaproteobacteria bacterium]MDZ4369923.1 hypothetical protein [Phenylobacterium sp.]OGN48666.1 MAG: hypothetical protein A3E24_12285 [Caulobacterales bacterium RIFCSPHIGHO2_12_FULL_68_13]OYX80283.1 MAG: hypothetical protein B7Y85_05895 [Brevundimonas sp. 32-68-21]EDX79309.1 hypothetical protein BBAL3_466 [Brevundimonas sp. BAL3]
MPDNDYQDDQEQSEVFDETHVDDEGEGDILLDEAEQVLDVTQADGDADEDEFDEDDLDIDDQLALDGIAREADALLGVDGETLSQSDADSNNLRADDEVELVYSGLMENERGAQASAAHWESKRLDDDDIEQLGYAPDQTPDPAP